MTTSLLRVGAISCALLGTTALTTPAIAQTNEPARRAVDANGVDLISGTFPLRLVEGSIGAGESAIIIERHGTDPGGVGNWQNMYANQEISGATKTVVVMLGDRGEAFTSTSGGAFVSVQANGATLTGGSGGADFTYTGADGNVITFGAIADDQGGASNFCTHLNANQTNCYAVATAATQPDGLTVDFSYDVHANCANQLNEDGSLDCNYAWRLDTISNSYGYGADFSYVSNSVSLHQNPSGNWFKRSGATLSNGGTTRTISNNFVSSTVTQITDADARVWQITSGTNSLGIRRPGSSSDDISVTFSGGIVTQVVRDGVTTNYSRSVSGPTATTTITDALSNVTTVVANTNFFTITSVTDPLSHTTSYTYDDNSRLTRVTRPEGDYTNYTRDDRGNITEARQVAKSGSGLPDIVTTASYDAACTLPVRCNKPNSVTDARGNVTYFTYDATHGGVLTVTAPAVGGASPQTRYSYTQVNGEYQVTGFSTCATGTSPSCVGTAVETRMVIAYDANGNATSVTRRDGTNALTATAAYTYDGVGNLLTVDGPISGTADTIRYRYNNARQVIGVVGPDPDGGGALHHRAIRITFGSYGQPTKAERGTVNSQSDGDWASFAALEEVQVEYDTHHRAFVQRLVSGATAYALSQTSYDGLGRVQCVARRMNSSEFATGSLPSDACTLDAQGTGSNDFGPDRIARTYYDAAGRVTQSRTAFAVSGQETNEATATYTSNGRIATLTDAEGNMTTYEYDGFDRLRNTRFPSPTTDGVSAPTSGTGADYEQLSYDAGSNVVSRRLRDGQTIAFTYDALDRMTLTDLPNTATYPFEPDVSYTYDLLGRLLAATASDTNHATFTYDALGRVTSEANLHGSASMQYDAAGRRTRLTYPGSGLYVDYVYNVAGDMTQIRENGATSGLGLLATYVYDDRGRRLSLTRGNGTVTTWTHDDVSRLTQLVQNPAGPDHDLTLGFSLNPAGQIANQSRSNDTYAWTAHYAVTRAYTTDGLNRHTAAGSATFTYDARGNLIGDGTRSYTYNAANRLYRGGAGNSLLYYDPLGRLSNVIPADWSSYRISLYDGHRVIAEDAGWGSVLRRFVYGPGIDEPLVWYEGSGTSDRHWLHADERGSIIAVSNDSGAVTAVNRYDEYGVPQGTLAGPFGYTGQQWIPELGMYYYRARIYSATLGRFMQTDPIGYGAGMNFYAYVRNDPINSRDPSGLGPEDPPCDDCGGGDVVVTGPAQPRGLCDGGFVQIGNVCVDRVDLASLIMRTDSFTFTTYFPPDIGPGVDCTASGNTVTCNLPREECPSGPMITLGRGFGATAFAGIFGLSVAAGPSIAVPVESLRNGSLRGMQISLSGSVTPLGGIGGFLGTGPIYSFGYTRGPLTSGLNSSHTTVFQVGVGDGGGVEVSSDLSPDRQFGVSIGPRYAMGVYGAFGERFSFAATTPQLGCGG